MILLCHCDCFDFLAHRNAGEITTIKAKLNEDLLATALKVDQCTLKTSRHVTSSLTKNAGMTITIARQLKVIDRCSITTIKRICDY